MTSHTVVERWLSAADHRRLSQLHDGDLPDLLQDILDFSDILPTAEMRPDAITLYTPVLVRELDSLCCPQEALPAQGRVSVLSPIGLALLGRVIGDQVSYTTPTGRELSLLILAVQPLEPARALENKTHPKAEGWITPKLGTISPS